MKPLGSKRAWLNLSTSSLSGTPYCSASEIAVANASIRPEIVRAFLGHRDEDLAGRAVLVHADGDVALVAADRELVGDRLALVGQLAADRRAWTASPQRRSCCFFVLPVESGWLRLQPSR